MIEEKTMQYRYVLIFASSVYHTTVLLLINWDNTPLSRLLY